MLTPNLGNSPCSTVGEEILLELHSESPAEQCSSSPEYYPTSPPPDYYAIHEAAEALEAAAIMEEMRTYRLVNASFIPGPSEAIHLAISPVPPPTPNSEHCIPPSKEEVRNVQKLERAILCYRQAHPTLLNVIKEWTDHLMGAIRVISHSRGLAHPVPITDNTFNDLSHLHFIPIFTDIIDPYMENSDGSIDTPLPTLLYCISTPVEIAHASTQTEDIEEDTDHPGGQWICFNPGNTSHYPLVFIGTDARPHAAKYIHYLSVNDGAIHQGTKDKDKAIYSTPLHAQSYPTPNFYCPGVKDTDHTIFHPSSMTRPVVDDALYHLGDPGVIADVHMLHTQHNKLENIKQQHLDLDN